MAGSEYFNSIHYGTGDESATNSEYIGSFCVERKIDLTNYIKWWGTNKTRQVDSVGKSPDDFDCELKTLECEAHSSEPYQMPRLGLSHDGKKCKSSSSVSAMSLLSRSSAFKNMQEKALKTNENDIENDDDNENKDNINKIDYRTKAVEKSVYNDDGIDRLGVALEVDDGSLPPQSNLFPSMPFLSAPLLSNYSSIDPLAAPVLWPSMSLIPDLPAGLPGTIQEVTKTETSTSYTFFQQDE